MTIKEFKASTGETIIIDEDSWPTVKKHTWYVTQNGYVRTYTSKKRYGERKSLLLHRLMIWIPKKSKDMDIDHINGNPLDNRRCNLRLCTRSQNMMNRKQAKKSKYSSKYKGVSWNKLAGKWVVFIQENGKRTYKGGFDNEEDAAHAYNAAAIAVFGEFARCNQV